MPFDEGTSGNHKSSLHPGDRGKVQYPIRLFIVPRKVTVSIQNPNRTAVWSQVDMYRWNWEDRTDTLMVVVLLSIRGDAVDGFELIFIAPRLNLFACDKVRSEEEEEEAAEEKEEDDDEEEEEEEE